LPLEPTFNYIDDFNTAWPNNDPDQLAEADDHLRGIKTGTKGSFPNLGQAAFTGSAQDLNKVAGAATTIIDLIYPVGAIYCSASSTDPNTLFGVGTWAALADKQTLVQQGTYAAGSTGGSSTAINVSHGHADNFTTAGAGGHTHTIAVDTTAGGSSSIPSSGSGSSDVTQTTSSVSNHTHTINGSVTNSGVSGANANMPPYLSVYMWQRTA